MLLAIVGAFGALMGGTAMDQFIGASMLIVGSLMLTVIYMYNHKES